MCKANGRIRENCDRDYANRVKYGKIMVSNCPLWLCWSKLKMLNIHEQSEIKNDWMNSTYFLRILESNSSSIFIIKLRISISFNQILGERANFPVDTFVKTYKLYGAIKIQMIKVQNIYFAQKYIQQLYKVSQIFLYSVWTSTSDVLLMFVKILVQYIDLLMNWIAESTNYWWYYMRNEGRIKLPIESFYIVELLKIIIWQ